MGRAVAGAVLLWLAGCAVGPAQSAVPALSAGMKWANLAWGFPNGGADQVQGTDLVLVDPDYVDEGRGTGYIAQLKSQGKIVFCYLSAGTIEGYRQDYKDNKAAWDALALGKMSSWDESWVDIRELNDLMALVEIRLDRLVEKGCQGVEPDNIDCYDNQDCWGKMNGVSNGNSVKAAQIAYNVALADAAHARGLAILQKNSVDLIDSLVNKYDGAITENCLHYKECGAYQKYVEQNKPHFATEYASQKTLCKQASQYPNMQTKWCQANKGRYLCKRSRKQKTWKTC